ncbi:MAG: IspD/TarI family cytidylyltransferase [Fervidobacterium sp.]|jgi:2-C-methyl-D-erythritol 4-phosphate cytidylyltransferase
MEAKRYAVLAFGGIGNRFGWEKPKQFYPLVHGKTILEYVVEKFVSFDIFNSFIVVSPKEYISEVESLIRHIRHNIHIIPGGNAREYSIWNAVLFLNNIAKDDDIVLIHDGVRPLVSKELVVENIEKCEKFGAAVTAMNSIDTISLSEDGLKIQEIIPRSKVYLHQTPQTFKYGIIKDAMERAKDALDKFSDDASIVLACGYDVYYVNGTKANFKITTIEDVNVAKQILSQDK